MGLVQEASNSIRGILDSTSKVSIKYDGAPSIVCGTDPEDNRFFIATKSIFNKKPVLFKNQIEIDSHYLRGEMHQKFTSAFAELSKLNFDGIVQGDLLFMETSIRREVVDGKELAIFHPNTIVYGVQPEEVENAKIGIAFHTRYTGNSVDSLYTKFTESANVSAHEHVWQPPELPPVHFSERERCTILEKLSGLQDDLIVPEKVAELLLLYANHSIRQKYPFNSEGFRLFMSSRHTKEIDSKKTAKGKNAANDRHIEVIDQLESVDFDYLFRSVATIREVKSEVIDVLNKSISMSHFLLGDRYIPTGPEGYVAVDQSGTAIKLIDREEFSRANFSSEYVKGWS